MVIYRIRQLNNEYRLNIGDSDELVTFIRELVDNKNRKNCFVVIGLSQRIINSISIIEDKGGILAPIDLLKSCLARGSDSFIVCLYDSSRTCCEPKGRDTELVEVLLRFHKVSSQDFIEYMIIGEKSHYSFFEGGKV